MSRYCGISILLIYSGLLVGCGGGDSGEYRTFQSQSAGVAVASGPAGAESGAAAVADPAASSETGAVATSTAVKSSDGESSGGVVTAPASGESVESAAGESGVQSSVPATIVSEQSGLSGPADRPSIDNGVSGEVRQVQLLVPQKRFRRERPSEAVRVSYDDIDLLKVLNMEPVPPNAVEHFPEWLKSLDGKLVRIRGFMYPTFVATGLTEFALARDNGICCFVRQPKIYDIMSVQLAEGETTDYIANRPFDVEGVFRIDPDADQPELSRLYRIEQAKVLQ